MSKSKDLDKFIKGRINNKPFYYWSGLKVEIKAKTKNVMGRWIKDEINGVPVTIKICKHNLSYLECEDCFGAEELRTAKVVDETKWWRRLLRRIK